MYIVINILWMLGWHQNRGATDLCIECPVLSILLLFIKHYLTNWSTAPEI